MDDVYSRMVTAMRDEGAAKNGYDMELAEVLSIKPLSININGVAITKNIYCNQAYLYPDDPLESLLNAQYGFSQAFKAYLLEFHKRLKIEAGDKVLVQRVKNNFYITGKVVKV